MAPALDDPAQETSGWQQSPQPIDGRRPGLKESDERRILIVDKHGIYRKGLRSLIETSIPQAAVCEANDLDDASPLFESRTYFDLILIDDNELGGRSRKSLQEAFDLDPLTRLAVLSTSRARSDVISSLVAGLHGFVLKLQPDEEITAAISDLLSGRIYVPCWFADGIDERTEFASAPAIRDGMPALTRRQSQVLSLLSLGLSNKEIAHELRISEGTTKIHAAALLRALGARNRTEAVSKAGNMVVFHDCRKISGRAPICKAKESGHVRPILPPSQWL